MLLSLMWKHGMTRSFLLGPDDPWDMIFLMGCGTVSSFPSIAEFQRVQGVGLPATCNTVSNSVEMTNHVLSGPFSPRSSKHQPAQNNVNETKEIPLPNRRLASLLVMTSCGKCSLSFVLPLLCLPYLSFLFFSFYLHFFVVILVL